MMIGALLVVGLTACGGNGKHDQDITPISVSGPVLPGKFTVNADGKQVNFSQGNLQATYDGTNWTWKFAENQYDYIGEKSGNTSLTDRDPFVSWTGDTLIVDLFGWVGKSSEWTGVAQYGITNSRTPWGGYGEKNDSLKVDWGNLPITNGGNPSKSGWRTMTWAEWTYIFNFRTGTTVNKIEDARYTFATINTDDSAVNGIILFPDSLNISEDEATTWGIINKKNSNCGVYGQNLYDTQCTTVEWKALEAKGCVFLPKAGYRENNHVASNWSAYWSSTSTGDPNAALGAEFYSGGLFPCATMDRYKGCSVRLVCDVK